MSSNKVLSPEDEYELGLAAQFLNLSLSAVEDLVDAGVLPSKRRDGKHLVSGRAILAQIEKKARQRESLESLLARSPKGLLL